jgi:CheY-like chemotaxis protein
MIPTERPVVPFPNMVPTEPTAGHRVLLVDDDDGVRDMMTATLEGQLAAIRVSLGGPQSWSKTSTLPS